MFTKEILEEFKLEFGLRRLTSRTIKSYYSGIRVHILNIDLWSIIVERTQTGKAVARQDL